MIRSQYPDARMEKEGKTLVEGGYHVTQIGWDRGRFPSFSNPNNFEVERLLLPVPSESLKVMLYLPLWWGFIIYKLFSKKYDIIHASDLDSFLPALLMAKIRRKIIIYDIFDFYAEMIRFPVFPKIAREFFSKIDRIFLNFSNAIILADDSRYSQMRLKPKKNIISIYNSPIDCISSKFDSKGVLIRENKKFTIFFGGFVSPDRNIDKVISAIKDMDDTVLIIMGTCSDSYKARLNELSSEFGNTLLYLDYHPHEEIIKHTLCSDLLFSLYDASVPNNIYSSPNKLFEAMMCGKPILINYGTSMANIVLEEKCGFILANLDIKAIKEAILKLKNDKILRDSYGKNGRYAYENKYSWEIMKNRLLTLYNILIEEKYE